MICIIQCSCLAYLWVCVSGLLFNILQDKGRTKMTKTIEQALKKYAPEYTLQGVVDDPQQGIDNALKASQFEPMLEALKEARDGFEIASKEMLGFQVYIDMMEDAIEQTQEIKNVIEKES